MAYLAQAEGAAAGAEIVSCAPAVPTIAETAAGVAFVYRSDDGVRALETRQLLTPRTNTCHDGQNATPSFWYCARSLVQGPQVVEMAKTVQTVSSVRTAQYFVLLTMINQGLDPALRAHSLRVLQRP